MHTEGQDRPRKARSKYGKTVEEVIRPARLRCLDCDHRSIAEVRDDHGGLDYWEAGSE